MKPEDKVINEMNEMEVENENSLDLELRTPEEMEEIFKLANIESSVISALIQSIYGSSKVLNQENDEYFIMEVDEKIMKAMTAEKCTIRGEPNEPAVFCTENQTYEIREAETSNTCLLCPDLKCSNEVKIEGATEKIIEVVKVKHCYNKYYELKECRPRLSKLKTMLESTSFKGVEYEKMIDPSLYYNWERLQNELQASDGEIKASLEENLIVELNGYYRLVSFQFESLAVGYMLDLIEENSWEIDQVDKDVSYDSLRDLIPKPVFELLFKKYTIPSKVREDGTQLYRYDEEKSCKTLANILLKESQSNNYEVFMNAWKMSCPEQFDLKEEYLHGIGIVINDQNTMKKTIIYFPETNLSEDLNKRLVQLFNVKKKWTFDEIFPYISKFTTKSQDVNAILTKFTRSSMSNNVKYYSNKHGV